MSRAQWIVFGELAALFGIELTFSATTRAMVLAPLSSQQTGKNTTRPDWIILIFFALGAAALLLLADVAPRAAEILAAILLVGVLFARQDPVIGWLTDVANWLNSQAAGSSSGGASAAPAGGGKTAAK